MVLGAIPWAHYFDAERRKRFLKVFIVTAILYSDNDEKTYAK
jgi:hypothetical protein